MPEAGPPLYIETGTLSSFALAAGILEAMVDAGFYSPVRRISGLLPRQPCPPQRPAGPATRRPDT